MTNLDLWYVAADASEIRAQFEKQMSARQRKAVTKGASKARTRDSMQELGKLTKRVGDSIRIVAEPPLIVPLADMFADEQEIASYENQIMRLIGKYRRTLATDRRALLDQYSYADLAMKVVGVGSVGTRCWITLMLGRDDSDPLFLQVKEAQESVLSRFWRAPHPANEGERVVAGQRVMQTVSDIFLGYMRAEGLDGQSRDFYVRQLRDWKFSLPIEQMIPDGMRMYGELCGWTLARAHARSGDPIAIGAYLGGSGVFDSAIADFAASYADQNQRDYDRLEQAAKTGEIPVERGV